jgi:hypothetical protein
MTKMKLSPDIQPDILWLNTPRWIVDRFYDLAEAYCVPIVEVVNSMRTEMLKQIQEDDYYDERIAEGVWQSFGGTVLNYDLDIVVAQRLYDQDLYRAQLTANDPVTFVDLMRQNRSLVGWAWFWAARDPNPSRRDKWCLDATELENWFDRMMARWAAMPRLVIDNEGKE